MTVIISSLYMDVGVVTGVRTVTFQVLNWSYLFKSSLYLMICGLWNFDVQRTGEDSVPAGADVSLTIHWERTALFSAWHAELVFINELLSACGLTCDPFLQTLVESTQADPVQQSGMEALEGFHVLQTCQDYIDVLSRALCRSGTIKTFISKRNLYR